MPRIFRNWRYITEHVPTGAQIACYAHDAGFDLPLEDMTRLIARWNAQGNTWRYWLSDLPTSKTGNDAANEDR